MLFGGWGVMAKGDLYKCFGAISITISGADEGAAGKYSR
jgi:hypothetical protein